MKVTIHQPEHFPYMGFFQKIADADIFIVLDNVNYRKNYFQNRNLIKNRAGDDEWFTVPVEKSASSKHIKDVQISPDPHWRKKIIKKIEYNLGFDTSEIYSHNKLIEINMASIRWAMDRLKINTEIVFSSDIGVRGQKSVLLSNLVKSIGATTYISGLSGKKYLDLSLFADIDVIFFEPKVENYYSCLYNLLIDKQ